MTNINDLTYSHHGSFHLNSTYWCNTYMGRQNVDIAKSSQEEQTFMDNLLGDIDALEYLIEHNLLEQGIQRIGAEQEIHLIDKAYKPAPLVMKMLPLIKDDHYTTEHATFNAEINVDPLEFSGNCISSMEKQLKQLLNKGRKALAKLNADMIYTGILPTISRKDLTDDNLTPLKRYHALATMYDGMRGEPFNIHIKGTDELITTINSTMFEGSNTSFQAHLQIEHPKFADHYNWAQLISGPVLSACTNSPLFLGRRLWRETRIALFQQSIDIRKVQETINYKIPRVFFGTDWVKSSPTEIFKEDVARHRVILYVPIKENSMKQLEQGTIPKLEALALHNGTIYRWNRPCYGIINGLPHLRIENRYLPAGPTLKDQMANMAFWLGLMNNVPNDIKRLTALMDFDKAKTNFISAAQVGLSAEFNWINGEKVAATDLILNTLLPLAKEGLLNANIDSGEADGYLKIIHDRVTTRKTGSQWMLDSFNTLRKNHSLGGVLAAITGASIIQQKKNNPVHNWELASIDDAGSWTNRYGKVGLFMSTDLFTVHENNIVKFAADIMRWRHIRHVPVVNNDGYLIGLLTSGMLLKYFGFRRKKQTQPLAIKELMIQNPVTISPESTAMSAINLMLQHKIGCLPVVEGRVLVGLVTEHDFIRCSRDLIYEFNRKT